jgi:stage II sporulation protein E
MALQTVNSALILRSQGERFATFDLVSVDLFTGDAEFIKVGASTTYVKRGGNISTVKSSTLPLGVVKGLEMPVEKKKLRAGDLIIMVTDGVLDASENSGEDDSWLVEFLAQTKTEEPKKLAQEILRKAKEKAKNQYQDDMTVLVGRIDRRF